MADMVELTDGNGDASAGETAVESSKLIVIKSWYPIQVLERSQNGWYDMK